MHVYRDGIHYVRIYECEFVNTSVGTLVLNYALTRVMLRKYKVACYTTRRPCRSYVKAGGCRVEASTSYCGQSINAISY